ncbi:NAD(P)-binding protein [Phellopilus nigrolimitatus]|nr:NAD(P)-binding protein [Phellopilus nigrolimitatus]
MPGINDSKCVLVVGATSGIGRALALAIHALPTKPTVIATGRRKDRLDELAKNGEEDGEGRFGVVQVDISAGRDALKGFIDNVLVKYPELDTIIFSAGIQNATDFTKPDKIDLDAVSKEVDTNYMAIFAMIKFVLPHFLKLSAAGRHAFIVPISSGLAILPLSPCADYCATKAALHSLSISLHISLGNTNVHVMEIMPPLVESELHDSQGTTERLSKIWMPLDEFTRYAMEGLQRGDFNTVVPADKGVWAKFEEGKVEAIQRRHMGK